MKNQIRIFQVNNLNVFTIDGGSPEDGSECAKVNGRLFTKKEHAQVSSLLADGTFEELPRSSVKKSDAVLRDILTGKIKSPEELQAGLKSKAIKVAKEKISGSHAIACDGEIVFNSGKDVHCRKCGEQMGRLFCLFYSRVMQEK